MAIQYYTARGISYGCRILYDHTCTVFHEHTVFHGHTVFHDLGNSVWPWNTVMAIQYSTDIRYSTAIWNSPGHGIPYVCGIPYPSARLVIKVDPRATHHMCDVTVLLQHGDDGHSPVSAQPVVTEVQLGGRGVVLRIKETSGLSPRLSSSFTSLAVRKSWMRAWDRG